MKPRFNPKLNITPAERQQLRIHKIKIANILEYATDELASLLNISEERARVLYALADFQRIPSVGIKFAEDLIFLGYYSVAALEGKIGATLLDDYEKKKGYKTDPCVEDQFRLAAHFAKNEDYSKEWWDFTSERKDYRTKHGYPKDRPNKNWTEVYYGTTSSS